MATKWAHASIQDTVEKQLRNKANQAMNAKVPKRPKQGWIRTIRKALGMSCEILGDRLGYSRNKISILERKEANGDITINQLKELAAGLNCELVYSVVPRQKVETIINDQAVKVARSKLKHINENMFLEAQSISHEAQEGQVISLANEIKSKGGRILWKTRAEK